MTLLAVQCGKHKIDFINYEGTTSTRTLFVRGLCRSQKYPYVADYTPKGPREAWCAAYRSRRVVGMLFTDSELVECARRHVSIDNRSPCMYNSCMDGKRGFRSRDRFELDAKKNILVRRDV